jgi:hypothetical protein
MTVTTRRDKAVVKTLADAYALHTYASYFSIAWTPALDSCTLMVPDQKQAKCSSEAQYDAFVSTFMKN